MLFGYQETPVLKADGSTDTLEKGEKYLEAIVKNESPRALWQSFLNNGSKTVEMLLRTTPMKFFWSKGYSDYRPGEPGGDALGRTCECKPFNIKKLGDDLSRFHPGLMEAPIPMPITGYGYKWMNLMLRKPLKAFPIIFKRLFQGVGANC